MPKDGKAKTSEVEISIDELDEWIEENKERDMFNKFWTPEEDAILFKYYSTVPNKILKKHFPGRSVHSIANRAQALDLRKR